MRTWGRKGQSWGHGNNGEVVEVVQEGLNLRGEVRVFGGKGFVVNG